MEQLVRENVSVEQIFVTGNTGIDALRWASGLGAFGDPALQALCDGDERVVVVTAHRRESWGNGLDGIAQGVARLAREHGDVRFVVPLHPNPLVRREAGRPAARPAERAADRAAELRPVREAAGTLPPRDHRLRRHPGGGARARQAGARHARADRADRGHRGGTLRSSGPTPTGSSPRAHRLLTDPNAYAKMARRPTPTATVTRPSGSSRVRVRAARRGAADPVRLGLQPDRGDPRGGLRRTARRHRCGPRTGNGARAPARAPSDLDETWLMLSSLHGTARVWAVPPRDRARRGRPSCSSGRRCSSSAASVPAPTRRPRPRTAPTASHGSFSCPALNEQVTIRDSVNRLLALDVAHRRIVVIDDGSDDATPQIWPSSPTRTSSCCVATRRGRARARPPRSTTLPLSSRAARRRRPRDGDRRHRRRRRAPRTRRRATPPRTSPTPRSGACRRSCASTTAGGC